MQQYQFNVINSNNPHFVERGGNLYCFVRNEDELNDLITLRLKVNASFIMGFLKLNDIVNNNISFLLTNKKLLNGDIYDKTENFFDRYITNEKNTDIFAPLILAPNGLDILGLGKNSISTFHKENYYYKTKFRDFNMFEGETSKYSFENNTNPNCEVSVNKSSPYEYDLNDATINKEFKKLKAMSINLQNMVTDMITINYSYIREMKKIYNINYNDNDEDTLHKEFFTEPLSIMKLRFSKNIFTNFDGVTDSQSKIIVGSNSNKNFYELEKESFVKNFEVIKQSSLNQKRELKIDDFFCQKGYDDLIPDISNYAKRILETSYFLSDYKKNRVNLVNPDIENLNRVGENPSFFDNFNKVNEDIKNNLIFHLENDNTNIVDTFDLNLRNRKEWSEFERDLETRKLEAKIEYEKYKDSVLNKDNTKSYNVEENSNYVEKKTLRDNSEILNSINTKKVSNDENKKGILKSFNSCVSYIKGMM